MFDIGPNARKKLLQPSGSLFIGHCDSNQLVEHYDSEHNTKLNPTYLLHLGMDRPSVNEKFECELATTLNERSKTAVLKLGSCLLHKVHTGYCKGINALKFDLNQFFYDILFFKTFQCMQRRLQASGRYSKSYCSVCPEAFINMLVIHEVCGSPNIEAM